MQHNISPFLPSFSSIFLLLLLLLLAFLDLFSSTRTSAHTLSPSNSDASGFVSDTKGWNGDAARVSRLSTVQRCGRISHPRPARDLNSQQNRIHLFVSSFHILQDDLYFLNGSRRVSPQISVGRFFFLFFKCPGVSFGSFLVDKCGIRRTSRSRITG